MGATLDSSSNTDYVDFSSKGRSQFIDQLEAFINRTADSQSADFQSEDFQSDEEPEETEHADFQSSDLQSGEDIDDLVHTGSGEQKTVPEMSESKTAEMEQVMQSGMQFLAGLFKMSTGKELGLENQQIKINKETGEVTLTFKLPV